jgi:hypothetical protein
MSPDKNAEKANNNQASDSELVHEKIDLSRYPQKHEAVGPEYERTDGEDEQNQGRPEMWHIFETP